MLIEPQRKSRLQRTGANQQEGSIPHQNNRGEVEFSRRTKPRETASLKYRQRAGWQASKQTSRESERMTENQERRSYMNNVEDSTLEKKSLIRGIETKIRENRERVTWELLANQRAGKYGGIES